MTATTQGLVKNFNVIVGTAISFTVVTTATTVLRVVAKRLTKSPFQWDDYTIFLALAFYIVTEGLLIKCVMVGRRTVTINDPYNTLYTMYAYIYSEFYFTTIALCIASLSLLYRRVFVKKHVRIITLIILLIDLGWWISSTILETILPATYPETFPGNPGQKQITVNYLTWWLSVGVIEVVLIAVTIFIPLRELSQLSLTFHKKIWLGLAFSMSYLCIGTGIARLATLYRPGASHFDGSIGDVWINTHLGSAIMSANLPLCWPVVQHRKRLLSSLTSWRRSSSEDGSRSESRSKSVGSISQARSNSGPLSQQTTATTMAMPAKLEGVRNVGGFNRAYVYDVRYDDSDLEAGDEKSDGTRVATLGGRTLYDVSRNRSETADSCEIQPAPVAHL